MCKEWLQGLAGIKGLTLRGVGAPETTSGSSEAQQGLLPLGEAVHLRHLSVRKKELMAPLVFPEHPFEEDILPLAGHLQELNFSEAARSFIRGIAPEVERILRGNRPRRYGDPEKYPSSEEDFLLFPNTYRFLTLCEREVCM